MKKQTGCTVEELKKLAKTKTKVVEGPTLNDVFLELTGKALRD